MAPAVGFVEVVVRRYPVTAILSVAVNDEIETVREPAVAGMVRLPISQIDSNPHQPRKEFDAAELKSLAESISAHGLLQPVVVRRVAGRYQLIAGHRPDRAREGAQRAASST